ncbi:hypothetical protein BwSH20_47490 [Bradyrhizobium ottawaense]|nr:hypothetical protein TM233_21020 [Bradyrhizobium sp. TM233]GMO77778.1 hypothetical protein BwSG20_52710 [Bradyrhizobium ottawaense]GMP05958.1 hypothetical protein BwSH20_47490 [Bradyrhizobium ottawaense]
MSGCRNSRWQVCKSALIPLPTRGHFNHKDPKETAAEAGAATVEARQREGGELNRDSNGILLGYPAPALGGMMAENDNCGRRQVYEAPQCLLQREVTSTK